MFFHEKLKILILGLGKSGIATVNLANKKGYEVIAIDQRSSDNLLCIKKELSAKKNRVILGFNDESLPLCSLIVISPGISPDSFLGRLAEKTGVKIISEIEFAYSYCKYPIIAITGTNGKTTVTELCSHLLNKSGLKTTTAGNIGKPLAEIVMANEKYDYIVLELSSFQLHYIDVFKPFLAVVLNIDSDHIDWHCSLKNYIHDKMNIIKNIHFKNKIIINYNLLDTVNNYKSGYNSKSFSLISGKANLFIKDGKLYHNNQAVCSVNKFTNFKAGHDFENLMAALAVCNEIGLNIKNCIEFIRDFKLGNHRMEFVMEYKNVKYINDSKSTNPLALIAAVNSCGEDNNICLIAGGLDKKMNFKAILDLEKKIKKVFLTGKSKNKLAKLCESVLNYSKHETFKDAVEAACDYSESGDIVLLSPGCASMDMFKNYEERGNYFKKLINRRVLDEVQS
ncbi:MAG TPA: UDP-N-acetylmuramoyl-L-alanine--D-glutamate ligase [Victivallales bacterium]|nr:UDP-N-acetylmuramoyl-L-alanine--D-glutamate ligase [Victivallales bacterium]